MALFKILKGKAANLPNTYHEGYCYFTTDTNKFYIDISSVNSPSSRVELNAKIADYAVRAYNDKNGNDIHQIYYGTCSSHAMDTQKICSLNNPNIVNFTPTSGVIIAVIFINGHVSNPSTLNVNASGNKKIYTGDGYVLEDIEEQSVILFMYDSTLDSGNGGWRFLSADNGSQSHNAVRFIRWEAEDEEVNF